MAANCIYIGSMRFVNLRPRIVCNTVIMCHGSLLNQYKMEFFRVKLLVLGGQFDPNNWPLWHTLVCTKHNRSLRVQTILGASGQFETMYYESQYRGPSKDFFFFWACERNMGATSFPQIPVPVMPVPPQCNIPQYFVPPSTTSQNCVAAPLRLVPHGFTAPPFMMSGLQCGLPMAMPFFPQHVLPIGGRGDGVTIKGRDDPVMETAPPGFERNFPRGSGAKTEDLLPDAVRTGSKPSSSTTSCCSFTSSEPEPQQENTEEALVDLSAESSDMDMDVDTDSKTSEDAASSRTVTDFSTPPIGVPWDWLLPESLPQESRLRTYKRLAYEEYMRGLGLMADPPSRPNPLIGAESKVRLVRTL